MKYNGRQISTTEITGYIASLQATNVSPDVEKALNADLQSRIGYSIETLNSFGFNSGLIAKVLHFAYVEGKNKSFLKQYIEAFKGAPKLVKNNTSPALKVYKGTKRGPYMTKARIKAAKAAARKAAKQGRVMARLSR